MVLDSSLEVLASVSIWDVEDIMGERRVPKYDCASAVMADQHIVLSFYSAYFTLIVIVPFEHPWWPAYYWFTPDALVECSKGSDLLRIVEFSNGLNFFSIDLNEQLPNSASYLPLAWRMTSPEASLAEITRQHHFACWSLKEPIPSYMDINGDLIAMYLPLENQLLVLRTKDGSYALMQKNIFKQDPNWEMNAGRSEYMLVSITLAKA